MTITRRKMLQAVLTTGVATALNVSYGQTTKWPDATVRIILPFSVGGASDVLTRLLAAQLQTKLGQNFIVDNRTGAGGNIGMEIVRNSKPDGYTIASATVGTLSINQFLFSKLGYDPTTDFDYVSMIWENCNVFVVAEKHPARSVQEFLIWARKQPKGVTYGSAGVGTTPHLSGELFRERTGIEAVHIPFRGASQSMPALMGGDVDFAIDNVSSYIGLIRSGKVRALAVTASTRWPVLPDVPTMIEAGIKDFVVTSWGSLVMPKGTPPAIISKLSAALKSIAEDPDVKKRFLDAGARAIWSTPQEAAAFAARERVKWKEVVHLSGAKLD